MLNIRHGIKFMAKHVVFMAAADIYNEWWYALYFWSRYIDLHGWWWRWCRWWSWGVCMMTPSMAMKFVVAMVKIPSKEYSRIVPKQANVCVFVYMTFFICSLLPVSMRLFIFIVVKSIFLPSHGSYFYSYIIFIFLFVHFFCGRPSYPLLSLGFFSVTFSFIVCLLASESCTLIFD